MLVRLLLLIIAKMYPLGMFNVTAAPFADRQDELQTLNLKVAWCSHRHLLHMHGKL